MNKSPDLLKARREYVRKSIDKAPSITKEITRLSKKLFLSESTLYKDLKAPCKDENKRGPRRS